MKGEEKEDIIRCLLLNLEKKKEWHASRFIPGKQERAMETEITALMFCGSFTNMQSRKKP